MSLLKITGPPLRAVRTLCETALSYVRALFETAVVNRGGLVRNQSGHGIWVTW